MKISISDTRWEYEDCLPEMDQSDFDSLFPASRVIDGVRMYPFVEDETGYRVWISFLPNKLLCDP